MARDYEDLSGENRYSDRRKDSIREIQEMEQIEKGLENFLKQELDGMNGESGEDRQPQIFDLKEDKEDVTWIPKKTLDVADFVNGDDEDEEEDYVAASGRSRRSNGGNKATGSKKATGRSAVEESYEEDWDNPRRRSSQGRQTRPGGSNSSNRAYSRNTGSTGKNASAERNSGRKSQYKKNNAKNGGRKNPPSRAGKPVRKKSGLKRFLVVILIIVLLVAALQYYLVGVVYNKMNYENIEAVATESMKDEGVINILLIGNDSRENGEDGRSDAMILLSVNSKSKKIYMTSILRDIYVDIPGHDGNRLNAAYSFGGAELLMETVEQNFDIEVNRYVLVNFEAFANLVDAVGGVDLELSSEEVEYVNAYLWEYNILTERPEGTDYMDTSLSGMVHLNGPQALAYSRNRYIGTDFGRTERQRKVLSAVIKNLPAAAVTNPKELIDGLMPNLTTNLTQSECYQLSFLAAKLLSYDIVQSSIPLDGTYKDATIRGMAVLEVDFEANKKYIQENIYSDGTEE